MTSWFEKGRPALLEALNTVCRQIDQDLLAELQRREKEAVPSSKTPTGGDHITRQISTAISADADKDWKAEYAKLSARFNALSSNFKKAREALQRRRDERDRWIQHAALLEKKIKAAEEEHGIQILDPGTRQTGASNHFETAATKPAREASFLSDGGLEQVDSSAPTTSTPAPAAAPRGEKDVHPDHDPDSTQGDSDDRQEDELPVLPQAQDTQEVTIKDEPSSDGPVFVSERCLRKRKRDNAGWETPNPGPVKVEPRCDGSSPGLSLHLCGFNPQESLDLGDVNRLTYTPRKRPEVEPAQQSDQQPEVHDSDATMALVARHGQGRGNAPQDITFSSALTPVNVNRQLPNWTASKPADKPLRKGLSHGISVLAEDGATYKKIRNDTPGNSGGVSPAVKGRLDTLLNSPSPREDAGLITHSARRARETQVTAREELPIPKPRDLPFEKSARQTMRGSTAPTLQAPRTPLSNITNTAQKMGPPPQGKRIHGSLLRNKPLSELRLDDFKVNPRANEGHDFAYSEVVRDKDERACLPGCVDMHCCGKVFRALALSQRPDPPLTAAQRLEEQKLLEDYLGDYAYRLAAMTREERSEMWVEAKMRELANKHGKHRHRFSRMRSPPGFWNADFPSTQELEADRAEAAKREKQAIQERHREAMRPGGRWIFRDE